MGNLWPNDDNYFNKKLENVALVFAGLFKIEIEDFFGEKTITKQNNFLIKKSFKF